jgi:hypothetical protein
MKSAPARVIPLVFTVVSLLYLAFSFSLESRRMIGDEQGWDPGSRALPVAMGLLMLTLSVYLAFREGRRPAQARTQALVTTGPRRLVFLTIGASVLYIALFVPLGFVLSTHLLVYTLVYFNEKQDVTAAALPGFAAGLFGGLSFVLALYSLGRLITRSLFLFGRSRGSALLTNRSLAALVVLAVAALLFLLLLLTIRPRRRPTAVRIPLRAVLVASGTTELLYLVFKQVFFVGLARGVIPW